MAVPVISRDGEKFKHLMQHSTDGEGGVLLRPLSGGDADTTCLLLPHRSAAAALADVVDAVASGSLV